MIGSARIRRGRAKPGHVTAIGLGVVTVCCHVLVAQQPPPDWARYRKPLRYESPEYQCSQQTMTSWVVAIDRDAIHAQAVALGDLHRNRDPLPYDIPPDPSMLGEYPPLLPPGHPAEAGYADRAVRVLDTIANRHVLAVDDGWLVGIDAGEHGGSLWWFPKAPAAGAKLLDGPIAFLLRHPGSGAVFALVGRGRRDAEAMLVRRGDGGGWGTANLPGFTADPSAVSTTSDGDVLVATWDSVLRIRGSGDIEVVATIPDPIGEPQSVVQSPSGDVYIGLRFFVLRLRRTPDGYQPEYYVPPGCARYRNEQFECVCEGGVPARARHSKR